jgi:hypothetical protein
LQCCLEQEGEVDTIGLIRKAKKNSKKVYEKNDGTNTGKKDLSKVMFFRCHEMGHYAS